MQVELVVRRTMAATPSRVFALATDAARFHAFFRGFGPIPALRRITLHGPLAVGVTRDVEGEDGACMLETVTALEPARHHAYTLSRLRAPLSWLVRAGHADWTFTPADGGTDVTWRYRFGLTSLMAWPIAAPLLGVFMRRAMGRCLKAIDEGLARI